MINPILDSYIFYDDYDYSDNPNHISVTTLIHEVRRIILTKRANDLVNKYVSQIELPTHFHNVIGSSIHSTIENIWVSGKYRESLTKAGYDPKLIDKYYVTKDIDSVVPKGKIPIYIEQRLHKIIQGIPISGKGDVIFHDEIHDIKTTSKMFFSENNELYKKQLSYLRWLKPSIITNDIGYIDWIFKDWSIRDSDQFYQAVSTPYTLYSYDFVENEINKKITDLQYFRDKDENTLPLCSEKEIGVKKYVYKYYSKRTNKKASKIFDDELAAKNYKRSKLNKGYIKKVIVGKLNCEFCEGRVICSQYKNMI